MADREELLSGAVFRLAKVSASFPANSSKPRVDSFEPSTKEKDLAKLRQEPVLLSVWDVALTAVGQARAFFLDSARRVAFRLDVSEVRGVVLPDRSGTLRVLRDPQPEYAGRPGADGHGGIEGLGRPKGSPAPKEAYKALRSQLCDLAKPLFD
jgi:hypothetical protein